MELNKIYNEDCLVGMKNIPDGSVDLIATDPPYNIARDNNFTTMGRAGIDFGEWDKGFDQIKWLEETTRVISKNGSIVIFNAWKNLGDISRKLESLDFVVKDLIRWKKTNPMPRNRDRRYITDYECAIWAVRKNSKWTFNRLSESYQRPEFIYSVTPRSEKVGHPTQKPVALMEDLIKIHSNEGQTILDPFMGSGTTAIACMNTGRNFIGFELDETYYEKSLERIKNHETQTDIFDVLEGN